LGIPGYYSLDGMGVDLGLYPGLPQFFTDNQFQYLDTLSIVHGKHSIKAGGEYRRTRNGSSFFNGQFSTVLPWGVEDVLTDLQFDSEADVALGYTGGYYGGAYYIQAAVDTTNSQAPILYRGYRANEVAGFVQDDWRVNNRLTLNMGLRWEYFGPPHNFQPGIDSNAYFGTNVTPIINPNTGFACNDVANGGNQFCPVQNPFYAGVSTEAFQIRDNGLWNKDTNNWSPRAGFAWDVFGTQKFVMRAGFGIMYDRIYNNVFENIRFNPPYFSLNTVFFYGPQTSPIPGVNLFSYPFNTRAFFNDPAFTPLANPRHMDQNIVTPYYEQMHFGFQWEFAKGYVFEPEYVGTFGRKLTGLSDINTFNGRTAAGAGSASRINPNIGADNYRSNGYGSNYHAFQATVRKAYSSGLTFNANYTFSKTLDDVSDLFNNRAAARPTDNMNHHNDYGPADFDTRHRMVVTVGYDLPFMKQNRWLGGWGVNSIISYQTGHPFSAYSSSRAYDLNKDGYFTDRIIPRTLNPADGYLHGSPSPADGILDPDIFDFDPNAVGIQRYTCPASVNGGLWCNTPVGRNFYFGPSFANVDFNVTKSFKVTEKVVLGFQANFFDLFNHPNFLPPGTAANQSSANFGQSQATLGDGGGHRVTQLALRLDF
jgi:hypothetical protein